MSLFLPDGREFACGSGRCNYRSVSKHEDNTRVFIQIEIEQLGYAVDAVIDTGGLYFIPHPDLLADLQLPGSAMLTRTTLVLRGTEYVGSTCRLSITMLANKSGEEMVIDTTAFIPTLGPGHEWPLPACYMGWHGCLERMRFAVDPVEDLFYFGRP